MENESNNTNEEIVSQVEQPETATEQITETLTKDISFISKFTNNLGEQISRKISPTEIIMFAAAFATLPAILLATNYLGSVGTSIKAIYALVAALPIISFAIAYWSGKNSVNPVSIFFHSLTSILLLTVVTLILPAIPGVSALVAENGLTAIAMPILAILFIFMTAKIKNSGSAYIFATIATIILFFYAIIQFLIIPCSQATAAMSPNAESICRATPFIQGTLIPVVIFVLGFFTWKSDKK